jgi:hypothetical protein
MGHYCWVCGRTRANEKFSGKGHARHVCKDCQRLPHEERDAVQALRDIQGFLDQRNISDKNISRLKSLLRSPNQEVHQKAELLLEVARLAPRKRKRWGLLARQEPELLNRLIEAGLLLGVPFVEEPDGVLDEEQPEELDDGDGADLSYLF